MIRFSSLLPISFLIICTPAWADEMKIQFTFGPPRPCTTVFPNPEIKMKSVPPGTRTIVVKFRREKNYEMGGPGDPISFRQHREAGELANLGPLQFRPVHL